MATKWYCNSKTGEIDSYEIYGNLTDFPRGVLLAYGDYITTGLNSKQDAEKWLREWSICPKCQTTRHGKQGDLCPFCKTPLISAIQQSPVRKIAARPAYKAAGKQLRRKSPRR